MQRVYEDVFLDILNNLHDMYKCNNLVISGGCAMNSVANGKIYNNTKFKKYLSLPLLEIRGEQLVQHTRL